MSYTADYLGNARGGIETSYRYLDNVDLTFSLPVAADNALGLPSGQLFGYLIYNNANQFSPEVVGDIQVVSNIDNTYNSRVYELWYEIPLSASSSFKAGLIDLNTEFDSIETAQLFIHSSHGIGFEYSQSGVSGPSVFPVTSLAVRFEWKQGQWGWRIAAFDAVPGDPDNPRRTTVELSSEEGALLAAELNYQAGITRYGLGAWLYTEATDRVGTTELLARNAARNRGVYGFIEQQDLHWGGTRFAWWMRAGSARDRVNISDVYLGAGIVISPAGTGNRAGGELGVALAYTRASNLYRELVEVSQTSPAARAETALELTYRYQLSPQLSLQPDLQYVINPGFSGLLEDTVVFGIRVNWSPF